MADTAGPADCPRRPGRPRSEEAERAILTATLDLLARYGIAGISMEAVAAQAGVAKTTVYRRWPNKVELVLAALVAMKGPVVVPPGRSVREDLIYILETVQRRATHESDNVISARVLLEAEDYPDLVEEYYRRIIEPRSRVFYQVLQRGINEGTIRPDVDMEMVRQLIISPFVCQRMWQQVVPRKITAEQVVDTVLAGIAPQSEPD